MKKVGKYCSVYVRDMPLKYYVNCWPLRNFVCDFHGRVFMVKTALSL